MSTPDPILEIARRSRSNLAFTLFRLPKERKRDMIGFYAFCRVVDDIADDPDVPVDARRASLGRWKDGLKARAFDGSDPVEDEALRLIDKYGIPEEQFIDVVRGVEMDLDQKRYRTFDELKGYCYRVASVVGLISARIFGCTNPQSDRYAENLGYALQITNILRDVGEDWREDQRIYLPQEDMERFDYSEDDLRNRRGNDRFVELMEFEASRADGYYAAALDHLAEDDRRSLRAAEGMRRIYSGILARMRRDGFRVFEKRYRLGRLRMLWEVLRS